MKHTVNVQEPVVLTDEELRRKKKINILDSILTVLCMIVVVFLLFFNFQVATVPSTSMYPTLAVKEMVVLQRIHGDPANAIDYGDIVTFIHHSASGDSTFIKRLIGKPGDTIQVTDTAIYRNGEKIEDPYRMEYVMVFPMDEITLGPDEFFLMGDNRNNSSDCRVFGPVKAEDIRGKAIFHCRPFADENCDAFVASVQAGDLNPEFKNN